MCSTWVFLLLNYVFFFSHRNVSHRVQTEANLLGQVSRQARSLPAECRLVLPTSVLLAQPIDDTGPLLAQRDPDPEPRGHFQEHECKYQAVLEAVAGRCARAAKEVQVASAAGAAGRGEERRRGPECIAVKDEAHAECESNGCCCREDGLLVTRIGE